jgi:ABC-2 type transport system permease protein
MRFIALFRKTMIENLRDWKILILTLSFAPFFVVLMFFYLGEAVTTYQVVVVNADEGNLGTQLVAAMQETRLPEESVVLVVREVADEDEAHRQLRNGSADVVVEIPANFTAAVVAYRSGAGLPPAEVATFGDPSNVNYNMAAVLADYVTYQYTAMVTGEPGPLSIRAETVKGVDTLTEFELYVPPLLALSLMMLMFTAAASIIKEKDKGTLVRLRISNMTAFEWLTSIGAAQVIFGLAGVALTYFTAVAFGYRSSASLTAIAVVVIVSCLAIIAISVLVAAWLRTIFDLMTIGCFPFFVLMFFSGGMFPLPDLRLFVLGDRSINVNDVLPTTHTISALDRIMTAGGDLGDVTFELSAIAALTAVFLAIGTRLFARRHLRATRH